MQGYVVGYVDLIERNWRCSTRNCDAIARHARAVRSTMMEIDRQLSTRNSLNGPSNETQRIPDDLASSYKAIEWLMQPCDKSEWPISGSVN